MPTIAVSPDLPVSSGEIQAIDLHRVEEVRRKHALLAEYLRLKNADAILICDPANYSWLTAGASNRSLGETAVKAAILVTNDARVILCNNVDSHQIFDRDLMGLGFLIKERPWTENPDVLRSDVCRGRNVLTDCLAFGASNFNEDLRDFRLKFDEHETQRLREVGFGVAHAIEATGRNFMPGATEAEVAGHLAHRLMKNRIEPIHVQVMADGQGWRYRNWSFGDDRIERQVVISVTGRKYGLHVSASRTVSLGAPSNELLEVHRLAMLVQATGIYFSQPGWKFAETWKRVARIYEKFGIPDEWRSAEQAKVPGYSSSEVRLTPNSQFELSTRQLICWHPSIRSTHVNDTFLINDAGIENLTPVENWPVESVSVKGSKVDRPGILVREV